MSIYHIKNQIIQNSENQFSKQIKKLLRAAD